MRSKLAELPPVVVIAGPTASGKSALALEAALRFDGEIINADSMQVYRELSVLTARPTALDHARIPHHLYGFLSAADPSSAGRWLAQAVDTITDIHARNKLPIVCGGTGLYLKVLAEGIAEVPDIASTVTAEAQKLYDTEGGVEFLNRLSVDDPVSAARLLPSDRQRLVRAYSVVTATGTPLSGWQERQSPERPLDARFLNLQIMPDRASLYQKIETRFDQMLDKGALEEVKTLSEMNLDPSVPAMKALGVPELLRVLRDEISIEDAISNAKKTTRNLAKRQMTWFRNQSKPDLIFNEFGPQSVKQGLEAIAGFLQEINASRP